MDREYPIALSALNTVSHTTPEHDGHQHTFIIEVPTQLMRERLNVKLYELGVLPTSVHTVRATVVSELFELMDEDKADEAADFLHEHWSAQDDHYEAMQRWQLRNQQRILDAAAGAKLRDPEPMPEETWRAREVYRAQSLMDMVNARSPTYRAMQARKMTWENDNARMMLRLAIVGCSTIDVDRVDGLLTEQGLENIHQAVGPVGLKSLIKFVNVQYGLAAEEIENLGSPSEKERSPGGSSEPSGESDGNDGSSTSTTKKASSTSPAPGDASETTTGKSSATTSGTKTRSKRSGRTAAA